MKDILFSCPPEATCPIQTSPPGLALGFPRALPQIPTSSVDLARYRASARPVAWSTIREPKSAPICRAPEVTSGTSGDGKVGSQQHVVP